MRVAIYSPYLDTFGGGEKYILNIAEILSNVSEVDLLFDNHLFSMGADSLKNNLANRFDLDLSKVNVINAPVGKGSNFLKRASFLKKYDLLFYLTDGSIFYPTAKRNILHIQSPLIGQPVKSLWGKLKLKGWDLIIYNSNFTKQNCQRFWPIKSEVIYPPCDVEKINAYSKPLKKKNYILSVGRFFGYLKDKKYELMIDVFKELFEEKLINGWSLNLAGSAGEGDTSYLKELKDKAKGLPVSFYPNLDFKDLARLYGESSIYWHAAGYQEEDPTKMEHFGISTVEAMAGGCVPIVISKGGQVEIIENNVSGMLWNSKEQLKDLTVELIKDPKRMARISKEARLAAEKFSKERFKATILNLV